MMCMYLGLCRYMHACPILAVLFKLYIYLYYHHASSVVLHRLKVWHFKGSLVYQQDTPPKHELWEVCVYYYCDTVS